MSYAAPDWIAHHALWTPEQMATIDLFSRRSFTYRALNERCARLAAYLAAHGVERGDRVAVLCHNSTDIFEVQFACRKLGAIFVPLNWRLAQAELSAILHDAAPRLLICGEEFRGVGEQLLAEGLVAGLVGIADGAADSDYEKGIASSPPLATSAEVTHDDVWSIMYTSGTTGRPKGAIITYRMTIFTGLNGMMKTGVDQAARGLTFLPLFHVGGLFLMANFIFHAGGTNIVMRTFDAAATLDALCDAELAPTHAFGVPTNFLLMSQLPQFSSADLSRTRCLCVGGAPSPMSLLEAYADKGVALQQGWGMTETATIGTVLTGDAAQAKIGSAGRAVMHAELAIVDEDMQPLPAGETGQLVIRGPTVTPGYWRQPEETARAFRDGWFLTGDAAYVDAQGYFYIVDRWKDMYISGGENVYPAEIESVLHRMPAVLEAAVIGVGDARWGEVGCAYIVRRAGATLTAEDVVDFCSQSLARFKLPRHVVFVDEIPHTAAGKIAKPELRRHYADAMQETTQ